MGMYIGNVCALVRRSPAARLLRLARPAGAVPRAPAAALRRRARRLRPPPGLPRGRAGRDHRRGRLRKAIDAVEGFVRREDAERFIEEVRGDDPELVSTLRIEEREREAGGLN